MPEISLVVAASTNNAIGRNNELLWNLPNDFKFFKNTTWAMPCIMGRKTFESMGKALLGRTNIVVTSDKTWQAADAIRVGSLAGGVEKAKALHTHEIFVIGGGTIYAEAMGVKPGGETPATPAFAADSSPDMFAGATAGVPHTPPSPHMYAGATTPHAEGNPVQPVFATRIYITRVHAVFENADTFFPEIDPAKWELTHEKHFYKDEKHAYDYSFQTWQKRSQG